RPPGLRARRLRRLAHSRAARAGRAPARAGGAPARAGRGEPLAGGGRRRSSMPASDVNRTIDAVWRIESPRLIAGLARIVRDVGVAEDLAQEALVAALEQWPRTGVPNQ